MTGGTRTEAIQYLLNRAEVEIHKGIWIDTAIGAGFVQSMIYKTVQHGLMVGVDFSREMLDLVEEPVERILGSVFDLPIRGDAANIATNIFCLSDYPNPKKAFSELSRIIKSQGVVMFLDYSDEDTYWTTRRAQHDNDGVIGNINLRNPDNIIQYLPENTRIIQNIIIQYEVDTSGFDNRVNLPDNITRAFLFIELYKPRSA